MGEHIDARAEREQKAKRKKNKNNTSKKRDDFFEEGQSTKPRFKKFINGRIGRNGRYEPSDDDDEDCEEYRGIKIK